MQHAHPLESAQLMPLSLLIEPSTQYQTLAPPRRKPTPTLPESAVLFDFGPLPFSSTYWAPPPQTESGAVHSPVF